MSVIEKIRFLVKDYGSRQKIADACGCTYQKIKLFEEGKQDLGAELFSKLCQFFNLDANTGLPMIQPGTRQVRRPKRIVKPGAHGAALIDENGHGAKTEPAETVIEDITDEEWALIEFHRQFKKHPDAERKRLMLKISSSALTTGQKHVINKVVAEDYFDAAQTALNLARTKAEK